MLLGRAAGLTEEKLSHLGDDPLPDGLYDPDEAAIVRYAQKSTRMDPIDDATYAALREHFDEAQKRIDREPLEGARDRKTAVAPRIQTRLGGAVQLDVLAHDQRKRRAENNRR